MIEIWKDIPGYEGVYKVSNFGALESFERKIPNNRGSLTFVKGKILKPIKLKIGYFTYSLRFNSRSKIFYAHRLVAFVFLPNPNKYTHVNHIDSNKENNRVDNLEWCTQKHNVNHALQNGLLWTGEKVGSAKLTLAQVKEIKKLISEGFSQRSIANIYKVNQSAISYINTGKMWKYELSKNKEI